MPRHTAALPATLPAPQLLRLLHVAHHASRPDAGTARSLLDEALDLVHRVISPIEPSASGLAPDQVRRLEGFIDSPLGEARPIERLAAEAGLSPSYLCRAFRAAFGLSPHAYVMSRRLGRAQRLMRETREPLSQIAGLCGFADQAHFSRLFAGAFDISPNRWRRAETVH